jgi:hypothetical protein
MSEQPNDYLTDRFGLTAEREHDAALVFAGAAREMRMYAIECTISWMTAKIDSLRAELESIKAEARG